MLWGVFGNVVSDFIFHKVVHLWPGPQNGSPNSSGREEEDGWSSFRVAVHRVKPHGNA